MVSSRARSRTYVLIALVAAVVSAAMTGCSGSAALSDGGGAQRSVKVGLIVPLTGSISATGLALRRGFELGVRKINASGGVGGKKVTYVVADDAGNPATSTQLARRLIQQDKVSMLFGTVTGDTGEAVSKVADDAEVPFGTAILGSPRGATRTSGASASPPGNC